LLDMAAGRPTKYNKAMLDKARGYLNHYEDCGDAVPTAAGMACELSVNKSTLYEWAKHHEDFSDTLDRMQSIQERKLSSGGLTGDFQPTIAKLMLANHGYHEKLDSQISGPNGGPMRVEVVFGDDGKEAD